MERETDYHRKMSYISCTDNVWNTEGGVWEQLKIPVWRILPRSRLYSD